MSDIPVGSPPAPPGRHAAPGGWYADPVDRAQERYWDGWQWSRTTRPRELTSTPSTNGYRSAGPLTAGANATTADGVPLATWLWRVLAAAVDGVFGYIVLSVILISLPSFRSALTKASTLFDAIVVAQQTGASPPALDLANIYSSQQRWLLMGVMLGFGLLYQVFFLRWKSATAGKLICGLKVVPVDQGEYAGRLGWGTIFVRAMIWVLPGVVSALSLFRLADALFPLWQAKRQAIHDVVAKTQVVRTTRR